MTIEGRRGMERWSRLRIGMAAFTRWIRRPEAKAVDVRDRYHLKFHEYVMEEQEDPPELGLSQFQKDKVEAITTLLDAPPHIVRGNFASGCGNSLSIIPGVIEAYGGSRDELEVRGLYTIQRFQGGIFIYNPRIEYLPEKRIMEGLESKSPVIILDQLGASFESDGPENLAKVLAALVKKDPQGDIQPRLFYTYGDGEVKGRDESARFEEALKRELGTDSISQVVARPKPFNDRQFREFVEAVYHGQGTAPRDKRLRHAPTQYPLTDNEMDRLIAGCEQFLMERNLPKHLKIVREFVEGAKIEIHRASGEYSMQNILEKTAQMVDRQLR